MAFLRKFDMKPAFSSFRLAVAGGLSSLLCLAASNVLAIETLPDLVNEGERDAALELISGGTDVNQLAVDGTTALHWAVYRKDVELVEMLLDEGANPNIRNDYGASPMTVASEHGNYPIMKALVDAGGDIESANSEGQTLLMAVARTGNIETAKLLLDKGANVNASENW